MSDETTNLFCWYDWDDNTTSVHSLSIVRDPKKPWNEYSAGDEVVAKLPKYGLWRGVIVEIGDSEKVLLKLMKQRQNIQQEMLSEDSDDVSTDSVSKPSESTPSEANCSRAELKRKPGSSKKSASTKKVRSEVEQDRAAQKEKKKDDEKAKLNASNRQVEQMLLLRREKAAMTMAGPSQQEEYTAAGLDKQVTTSANEESKVSPTEEESGIFNPLSPEESEVPHNPSTEEECVNPTSLQEDSSQVPCTPARQWNFLDNPTPLRQERDPGQLYYPFSLDNYRSTPRHDPSALHSYGYNYRQGQGGFTNYSFLSEMSSPPPPPPTYTTLSSRKEFEDRMVALEEENNRLKEENDSLKSQLELRNQSDSLTSICATPSKIHFLKKLASDLESKQSTAQSSGASVQSRGASQTRRALAQFRGASVQSSATSTKSSAASTTSSGVKKIKLVSEFDVWITPSHLSLANHKANGSAIKLVINLLDVFFTRETLAESSAKGSRSAHNKKNVKPSKPLNSFVI